MAAAVVRTLGLDTFTVSVPLGVAGLPKQGRLKKSLLAALVLVETAA